MASSPAPQAVAAFTPEPWMSDPWLDTWWEHFGAGQRFALAVPPWDVLLPLKREQRWGVRRLRGFGHASQRCSLRCPPAEVADAAAALGGALARRRDWDWLDLDRMMMGQAAALAKELRAEGLGVECAAPVRQYHIPLGRPWALVAADCGRKLMAELARKERGLRRLGRLEFEVVATPRAVAFGFEACLRLEAAGWKGRADTAMLSSPAKAGFYRALVSRLAAAGQLRLALLRLDAHLLAFNLCVAHAGALASLKIGYNEAPEWRTFGPGQLLQALLLRWAHAEGLHEFDLLGGEDATKAAWTPHFRALTRLRAFHRTWRGRAAGLALRRRGHSRHHGACASVETSAPPPF
jgi:CelD/BcsL family acetyltransferase involved in cellulose biosynthesis